MGNTMMPKTGRYWAIHAPLLFRNSLTFVPYPEWLDPGHLRSVAGIVFSCSAHALDELLQVLHCSDAPVELRSCVGSALDVVDGQLCKRHGEFVGPVAFVGESLPEEFECLFVRHFWFPLSVFALLIRSMS